MKEDGYWTADRDNDEAFLQSDDFEHDVTLLVRGDFRDVRQKLKYAIEIARRLNAYKGETK